jgi:mRNA-degrading endonuclease toxin of MazEF toxin-antitoxin module
LNDTFDAAVNKIKSLSVFWLNSFLYTTYDDFSGYANGSFTTNTNWDITLTTNAQTNVTCAVATSTSAGGSNKELVTTVTKTNTGTSGDALVKAINLTANRHKFARIYVSGTTGGASSANNHIIATEISFNKGSNYDSLVSVTATDDVTTCNVFTHVLVIAKGGNEYDCYVGGKLIRTVTDASFQLWFKVNCGASGGGSTVLYMTDFRESSFAS